MFVNKSEGKDGHLNSYGTNESEKRFPNIQNNQISEILPISTKIRKHILDKIEDSKWLEEIQKSYGELQEKKLLVYTNTDSYSSYFLNDLSSEVKPDRTNNTTKYERCAWCTLPIGWQSTTLSTD